MRDRARPDPSFQQNKTRQAHHIRKEIGHGKEKEKTKTKIKAKARHDQTRQDRTRLF